MNASKILEVLKNQIELKMELESLIKELFRSKYGAYAGILIADFESDMNTGMEANGCLQPLSHYEEQYRRMLDYEKNK